MNEKFTEADVDHAIEQRGIVATKKRTSDAHGNVVTWKDGNGMTLASIARFYKWNNEFRRVHGLIAGAVYNTQRMEEQGQERMIEDDKG